MTKHNHFIRLYKMFFLQCVADMCFHCKPCRVFPQHGEGFETKQNSHSSTRSSSSTEFTFEREMSSFFPVPGNAVDFFQFNIHSN